MVRRAYESPTVLEGPQKARRLAFAQGTTQSTTCSRISTVCPFVI